MALLSIQLIGLIGYEVHLRKSVIGVRQMGHDNFEGLEYSHSSKQCLWKKWGTSVEESRITISSLSSYFCKQMQHSSLFSLSNLCLKNVSPFTLITSDSPSLCLCFSASASGHQIPTTLMAICARAYDRKTKRAK